MKTELTPEADWKVEDPRAAAHGILLGVALGALLWFAALLPVAALL
jgi:hypothetical protein